MDLLNVSVIIPTYNRKDTIKRSIDSVINQNYNRGEIEIIVVDDGSTDGTVEYIKSEYKDDVSIVRINSNLGANYARNVGIENAKYDLIAFQDSDDEWYTNKLDVEIDALISKKVDLVACGYMEYNGDKKPLKYPLYPIIPGKFVDQLFERNFVCLPGLIGKKQCFESQKFDVKMPRLQDWDLSIRLANEYKFSFIEECLFNHFIQNDSITKKPRAGRDAVLMIMEKNHDYLETHKHAKMMMFKKLAYFSMEMRDYKRNYYIDALKIRPFDCKVIIQSVIFYLRKIYSKLQN